MAVLRGQRLYFVDDKEKELIECSIDGRLLRQLKFPPNAPKSLSGALSLCDNLLWVSFETTPYAFAVDLSRWKVIEERSWEAGKRRDHLRVAVVKALFATSDKTNDRLTEPGQPGIEGDLIFWDYCRPPDETPGTDGVYDHSMICLGGEMAIWASAGWDPESGVDFPSYTKRCVVIGSYQDWRRLIRRTLHVEPGYRWRRFR